MTPLDSSVRRVDLCEVCGSDQLTTVLDLGCHPLCDDLAAIGSDRVCREYPIEIMFCRNCSTAQQRFQVSKTELFPISYHYRARFTADVLEGMAGLVASCERFGALAGKTVLDVGCNDGSLLKLFRDKGAVTVGVEPTDACQEAAGAGHATYQEYFSPALAERIVADHGQPDLITFTNVFAHVEDLPAVMEALRVLAAKETLMVIENHYLGSVLAGHQFDTFYHEHARTYSARSFLQVARSLNRQVVDLEFPARYGGNIRVFLRAGEAKNVRDILHREENFVQDFARLSAGCRRWQQSKRLELQKQCHDCGPLLAKAFPARAAILIGLLDVDQETFAAVYEKPGSLKIGHYVPGTRIPIRSDDELFALPKQKAPLWNLAWHIPKEIRGYLRAHNYGGKINDIVTGAEFEEPQE